LLGDDPWYQIASSTLTATETVQDAFPADLTLQGDLDNAKWFRQFIVLGDRRYQYKQLVSGRVGHQLKIVRRVLVVTSNIQSHHLLEELFCCWIERK
jgi:hypothetical protein